MNLIEVPLTAEQTNRINEVLAGTGPDARYYPGERILDGGKELSPNGDSFYYTIYNNEENNPTVVHYIVLSMYTGNGGEVYYAKLRINSLNDVFIACSRDGTIEVKLVFVSI